MPVLDDNKFKIRIVNWDKWQAKNTSKFIRLSTRLIHDPDFFELTLEQRYVWVALLLHAGCVGVEFKLSASSARVLFKLRPGWKALECFSALENKGLISFDAPIIDKREKILVENPTIKEDTATPKKASVLVRSKTDLRFDDFWSVWPKRLCKADAKKAWMSGRCDGAADVIIDNVKFRIENEVAYQDPSMKHIPYPATFLRSRRWEDEMIQTKEARELTYSEKLAKGIVEIEDQRRRDGLDPKTGEPLPGGNDVIAN